MSSETPEIAERPRGEEPARDGILEDDNPIPSWFNATFYASIVFAIAYILYHQFSGWTQIGRYTAESEQVEQLRAQARPAAVHAANPFRADAAAIAEGQEVFATICSACHLADGRGLVGPSLIDPYFKYGSEDPALYETVARGRPGGMPAWESQLGTDKIWKVLAYVESLPRSAEPGVGAPDYAAPAAAAGATP